MILWKQPKNTYITKNKTPKVYVFLLKNNNKLPKGETLCAGKILNLLTNNIDTAFIRSIKLENHVMELIPIKLPRNRQNCRRFPCSWRSVKQQMRQFILARQSVNCSQNTNN